jgi:hypothetical protein
MNGDIMKIKLFLKLGLLCTVFSGIAQAQGRTRLSVDEINDRKQLYFQSEEYKKLPAELKSLVNKFAFDTQKIDGDLYRLSISGKGVGRENELRLRCVVNGEMKTISQLQADNKFNDWVKYQAFDPKGKWVGAEVVGDVCSSNLNANSASVAKSSTRPAIYTHSLKPNIKLLQAAQSQQAFYKKLLDGLSTKPLAIAENICLQGLQSATQVTAQSTANAFKAATANTAAASTAAVTKSASSFVKMGKFAIPAAAVTGVAALAYKYGFQQKFVEQPVVEEKSLSKMAQLSKYCRNNPGTTIGAVASIAALGYGAYKLYNSDIFAESKKEVVEVQ